MNKTLIFVVLCGLGALYFAPGAAALLPLTVLETLYSIPRTWYAGVGLVIGVVVGSVFKEPSEPREAKPEKKKLRLKGREEPDEQLEALKRQFTETPPTPKVEPVKPEAVVFDLDREVKLALIKIANMNGAPAPLQPVEDLREVDPHADH